jgi:hypothetical protein
MKGEGSGRKRQRLSLSATEINVIENLSFLEIDFTGRPVAY